MKLLFLFQKLGGILTLLVNKMFSIRFFFGASVPFIFKIIRLYGMTAFIITLMGIVYTGVTSEGTVQSKFKLGLSELAYSVVTTDQYIYDKSVALNNIQEPSLFDVLKTTFWISIKSFYFVWWFWLIKKAVIFIGLFGVDKSVVDLKVNAIVFFALYLLVVISNITYMVATHRIVFDFVSMSDIVGAQKPIYLIKNIMIFFDTIFSNWVHFLIAFKGIFHFIIFNLSKLILLWGGQDQQTNIKELANLTL